MMMQGVANVIHCAKYVTWRTTMSEPAWLDGDDTARGIDPICDNCDNRHDEDSSCVDTEPDRMWGDEE